MMPWHFGKTRCDTEEGNVKHWHGAAKDSWFQHIAQEISGESTGSEWCEPVHDEQYNKLK